VHLDVLLLHICSFIYFYVRNSYLYYILTAYLLCFNIILAVVLYGCETWSPTLREERRLRVFANGVLRGIFGLKRDEVRGEWKKTT